MTLTLANALFLIGIGQLSVLIASARVPAELNWGEILRPLPKLVRQLFWIYGAYIVLSIISLSFVCLILPEELASGSPLSRAIALYGGLFWGIRLSLQPFLDAGPYLKNGWLRTGYHGLTVLFASFTIVYGWCLLS